MEPYDPKAKNSRVAMDTGNLEEPYEDVQLDELQLNDWSDLNNQTISKWRKNVEVTSFVYNEALDKYTVALQRALIVSLICGALGAIFAGVNVILSKITSIDTTWFVFGCSVASLVSSAIVAISTGLIKVGSWDDKIRNYTLYVERLSALWILLRSELDISAEYRIQAGDFIKRMHGQYINLVQQGPYITRKECEIFFQNYKDKKFKDFTWNNHYEKTSEMV